MKFTKAKNGQAKLTMSIYGPPGSGKTCTSLMFAEGLAELTGKRVAFVDTEEGSGYYSQDIKERTCHPEAFDFDVIHTRSLLEVLKAVKGLDPKEYGVIVIDSVTHFWESAIASWDGKTTMNKVTKMEGIPMYAWGFIKKPYKELIKFLMDSPFHIIILGRQKDEYANDEKVGVTMKAEGDTPYETQICIRMESRKSQKNTTLSTVLMFVEKDRTSILSGKTFPSPTFKTIEPLLRLLASEQVKTEDPEEVAEKDSELLTREKAKSQAEKKKSEELFTKFNTEMQVCRDLVALDKVHKNMAEFKEDIKEPRKKILRETYKTKKESFSKQNEDIPTAV